MATVKIMLREGLKVGETVEHEAELRHATVGDVLAGTSEAEKLVALPDGTYSLIPSSTALAVNILRRQLLRIGDFSGPFTPVLMERFSAYDLGLMQRAASALDGAGAREVTRTGKNGRPRRAASI